MSGNDPRDASLEVPLSTPRTWTMGTDAFGAMTMLMSGMVMVTRNRYLAWPALLVTLVALVNQQPLRTKDGGSALNSVLFAISGLIVTYLPQFIIPPSTSTQLPVD
ncbi:hypothetical protein EXIGLDRAFT_765733 [Exidia glandulosa HHB12029]|uniref:Uncharacterized protein n=1 Tax=Exidia glandulosa HHB12029 TaxID=1314781 RepID=A0A166AXK3_EXIGL|nr:hypothetical protein EXIGLDRAFT_765733 [Exidia glandulosa HHB12029]